MITQENEMVDWYGNPAGDCLGYLIHGVRWAEVEPTLRPSFAWQVCAFSQNFSELSSKFLEASAKLNILAIVPNLHTRRAY
jgi:hypothetical protein